MIAFTSKRIHRRAEHGYTLVEIMVSLLIGAMLIGAVISVVIGSGLTGRRQDSQSQLAEDGQIAINLLASQLRMAGHWIPASPMPSLEPEVPVLFGCQNGFAGIAAAFADLDCATGTGNDAIAIRYAPTNMSATVVNDCLGAQVTAPWVDNRYYIGTTNGNPALMCRGNGGTGNATPQALIPNVESMQLRYGVADVNAPPPPGLPVIYDRPSYSGQTTQYLRASELTDNCSSALSAVESWCSVTSVRICLIMRSADTTAETGFTYTDCDGEEVTSDDRRIRRAVTTTISLRNRTAVAPGP